MSSDQEGEGALGRLDGRLSIVTGAAHGIGAAIARRLSAEGARVICVDLDPAVAHVAASLRNADAYVLDVSDAAAVHEMVSRVLSDAERIDILVNNAGIDGRLVPLAEGHQADFDRVVDVNLGGCWLMMRAVLPAMVAARKGAIINISSVTAMIGYPSLSIYAASKAGMIGISRSAAVEYGHLGIRVNAICPGGVKTRLADEFGDRATLETWIARHALKRFAEPEEIAAVTAFVASDDASFVTGAVIPVDGGLTAG